MKVENMYKLYEALKGFDKKVEWSDVVQLSEDEENTLTDAFATKNPNAYTLYQFYLYVHDDDDVFCEKDFEHLEIANVKNVIACKILDAYTEEMGLNIFKFFDQIPSSFRTEEEFFTYLNSMPQTLELPDYYADDVEAILARYNGDRVEIIRGIAQYYEQVTCLSPLTTHVPEKLDLSSGAMRELLKLLSLDYDAKSSVNLMLKWDKVLGETDEHNSMILNAEEFLLSAGYAKAPHLPRLFTSDDIEQYPDIIETVRNMVNHLEFDMLRYYTDNKIQNISDKKLLREKLNSILNLGNHKSVVICEKLLHEECFEDILNSKLSPEEKNEQLSFVIQRVQLEETSDIFTKLLLQLPMNVCRMIPEDVEREKLAILNESLWLYQDRGLLDIKREETYDLFQKLSALSIETNQKFATLLEFMSFLEDPKRNEILPILLSKENEPSFDYIFNQYQRQEQMRKQKQDEEKTEEDEFQVELATVVELLDLGYDMDAVLDGFENGENITSKTLVRSMKYKESC